MVVSRKPFSRADRLVAVLLAAACLTGGGVALFVAIQRRHLVLGILTLVVIAVGVLYAGAAWKGRPWSWSVRRRRM